LNKNKELKSIQEIISAQPAKMALLSLVSPGRRSFCHWHQTWHKATKPTQDRVFRGFSEQRAKREILH
jgi:hypothetical protein